jgi:anaerobic selenocysteine-containing dehydrogenase
MSTEVRKTHCNRDCPDACALHVTIEDGRAVRLQGDPEHPVTQGFLCERTNRFLERQYDPDRLTSPLLRRDGELQPVPWDEALDFIAAELTRIREESGPAAVMHYRSGGSLGLMKHVVDAFFERFGPVTVKGGDICTGAGDVAQEEDFGDEDCNDLFDLLESRNILVWGKNPHAANVHLLPVLKQARAVGARITLIDPVHHRGTQLADEYLQVRPGGDSALALGAARLLFESGRTDPEAPDYCENLEGFRALAESRSVADWAGLADLTVEQVELIATALAEKPCAVLIGWGMQRRAHGSATIRVLDALTAISGNVGIPGGGANFYFKRRGAFDTSFVKGEAARRIPEPLLGPGVLAASDPPVRALWVTAGNPVAMLPESRTVQQALSSRELCVVVDSFLTDSAACATVVLPTTTMLEDEDLLGAYGNHWLGEVRAVLPPPAGVKTDLEIINALARRLDLDDELQQDAEWWKRRLLAKVADKGASLEELRRAPVRNPLAAEVMHAERRFATPSGKVRLITEATTEPARGTKDRPLVFMSQSTAKAQGSQTTAAAQSGPLEATVHPEAAPGFKDGDFALLESDVGALTVRLRFDAQQRRDVVLADKGGWLSKGRCANAIIPAKASDAGGCAAFLDTAVRLLPVGVS